jgi:hypothetical protein
VHRIEQILAQAARRISSGDVIGAREMLAAAQGGAQGPVTFALAETYDPNMLALWGSRGVNSDVARAKALYRNALELGVTKANMRLAALTMTALSSLPIAGSGIQISVATQIRAEPAARVRLPIQIGPVEALVKSFVRLRGLPPAAALSEGHAIAPGSWAVPLIALPTLSIILPGGVQGQSDVVISLVNVDGSILAEAQTLLVVAPTAIVPSLIPMPTSERERALGLHDKGIEQLERGNAFAARRLLEQAAEAGLAQSAVALAATYDPDELAKLNVVGLVPDVEVARKWYEKARELGAVEASAQLRHLGASNQRSTGFVAVVATKKSRMDALKALYGLQQIYPDVLAAKTSDVQVADLGDKGVWYRVVVGPPGSRDAATSVCSQLKSAGHNGCWIAAY